jgi:hypothetical protein
MERHFLEEQKKLNEKEEMLKRDEQDRLEKERRIKEMEQELNRQKVLYNLNLDINLVS